MNDTQFRTAFRDLREKCGLSQKKAWAYFTPAKTKQNILIFETNLDSAIQKGKRDEYEEVYAYFEKVHKHMEKAPKM